MDVDLVRLGPAGDLGPGRKDQLQRYRGGLNDSYLTIWWHTGHEGKVMAIYPQEPQHTRDPDDPFPSYRHPAEQQLRERQDFPAGWYPDQAGITRWWDGQAWTHHTQAPQPASQPARQEPQVVVVNNIGTGVVIHRGMSGGEHLFHGFMTVITVGLWLPIYLFRWWVTKP